MSLLSLLSWLPSGFAQNPLGRTRRQRPAAKRRPGRRLRLEHLEGRTLMSGLSLRAVTVSDLITDINAANAAAGTNTITLAAPTTSPYLLTAVNNSTNGATGLPVIAANDRLTIVGNGDTIERSTASGTPAFRLLEVASGGSLTLENLTLQGGLAECVWNAQASRPPLDGGGAIFNQGTLVLNAVTVQENMAVGGTYEAVGINAAGGGIFCVGGSVTLEGGSIVQNNEAHGGEGDEYGGKALGGGIYASGATVTVSNSTLDNNSALGGYGSAEGFGEGITVGGPGYAYGGGIYASGATVTMTNSTLEGNVAGYAAPDSVTFPGEGGGLYLTAGTTATLDPATVAQVTGNTASSGTAYDNIVGTYTLT